MALIQEQTILRFIAIGLGITFVIIGIIFLYIYVFSIPLIIIGSISIWMGRPKKKLPRQEKQDSVLEVLKIRYAKGEITKEEFEEKRDALTEDDD